MRAVRGWFTAAAVLTFASVAMGALVCATQSGAACPDWPGCYQDRFLPVPSSGLSESPLVEFSHRLVAGVTGPAVLIAALLGRKLADSRPRRLAYLGLLGTLAAGAFGMLIVRYGLPWWLSLIDLASAFVATCAMMAARILLDRPVVAPDRTARIAWAGFGSLAAMHLLGVAVAGTDSFTRCLSWPLGVLEADRWPVVQGLRLGLAGVAALLLVLAAGLGLRHGVVRAAGWLVIGLICLEVGGAIFLLAGGGGVVALAAYAVTAAALFGAAALLACLTTLTRAKAD